jgi:antitoxin StbD
MDTILCTHSIGISDLRESPARVFEQAGDDVVVVVLNHNRPAGYILSTQLMARILDQLADRVVTDKARDRLATLSTARKITLDEL